MTDPGEDPMHPAVEGPEEALEKVRHPEETLRSEIDALRSRERELLDRSMRLQADFENFRRRTREELAASGSRARESLLRALLPALDNLDRALAHVEDAGLEAIARQLREALASEGVSVLDPMGEAFDARFHEAIAQEERGDAKPGTIVAVAAKGYAIDGRVARPARVVVSAAPPRAQE